jgi:hypothetical protein
MLVVPQQQSVAGVDAKRSEVDAHVLRTGWMFEQDIRSMSACRRKRQRTRLRREEDDVTCEEFEPGKKELPVYDRVIPRIATAAEPMMRGARRPVRAANQAPKAIPMLANTFGGTVILGVLFRRKVTMRYREV